MTPTEPDPDLATLLAALAVDEEHEATLKLLAATHDGEDGDAIETQLTAELRSKLIKEDHNA